MGMWCQSRYGEEEVSRSQGFKGFGVGIPFCQSSAADLSKTAKDADPLGIFVEYFEWTGCDGDNGTHEDTEDDEGVALFSLSQADHNDGLNEKPLLSEQEGESNSRERAY